MMVYDIDADAAFDVLKWRSQESNIKLRLLAGRLMSQFQPSRIHLLSVVPGCTAPA
jgi:hypothetical protein